jgi:uncharacterized sodium:solute symporter family permease YidK
MKKVLLLLSISIITLWIIGFFILKLPPAIHILLAVSILIYIRSLWAVNNPGAQKYYNK